MSKLLIVFIRAITRKCCQCLLRLRQRSFIWILFNAGNQTANAQTSRFWNHQAEHHRDLWKHCLSYREEFYEARMQLKVCYLFVCAYEWFIDLFALFIFVFLGLLYLFWTAIRAWNVKFLDIFPVRKTGQNLMMV